MVLNPRRGISYDTVKFLSQQHPFLYPGVNMHDLVGPSVCKTQTVPSFKMTLQVSGSPVRDAAGTTVPQPDVQAIFKKSCLRGLKEAMS